MKTDYVSSVIRHFFDKRYSPETEENIQRWLIEDNFPEEKDHALLGIWNSSEQAVDPSVYDALANVRSTLGMPDRKRRFFRINRILRVAAVLFPTVLIAGAVYFYLTSQPPGSRINLAEVSTTHGERKQLVLPDGSEVWLNAGSTINYPKRFDGRTRTIELKGEAFFSVEKDAAKPFIVKTKLLSVQALGTEFNVEAYPDDNRAVATLSSGKIRVDIVQNRKGVPEASYTLEPNQQLIYDKKNAALTTVVSADITGWRDGELIFRDVTFRDVVNKLERHYNVSVRMGDYKFSADRYSIRFVNGESVRQVMDVLKDVIGDFTYTINGNEILLRPKPVPDKKM